MIQKSKSYIYGNTARKLDYDEFNKENDVHSRPVRKRRTHKKAKIKAIFTIIFAFVLCMTIMYRYASIVQMNYEVNKMEKAYNDIRNDNSRLTVEVEKQIDLSRVREIAQTKLNMMQPDKSQVTYVEIPRSDYTIVADGYKYKGKAGAGNNMFAVVFEKVSKFIRMFY